MVDPEESMRLPEGKTCGDCKHIRRCTGLGFQDDPKSTWCDFAPSRFALRVAKAEQTEGRS